MLLAQAIEGEAAYLHAWADLVDESGRRRVVRNGHLSKRTIQTSIGAVEVRLPRGRDRRLAESDCHRFRYCLSER
jgi:hypothetical protein